MFGRKRVPPPVPQRSPQPTARRGLFSKARGVGRSQMATETPALPPRPKVNIGNDDGTMLPMGDPSSSRVPVSEPAPIEPPFAFDDGSVLVMGDPSSSRPPTGPSAPRGGFKKGGSVGSASRRADGIAQRGKTKGKFV